MLWIVVAVVVEIGLVFSAFSELGLFLVFGLGAAVRRGGPRPGLMRMRLSTLRLRALTELVVVLQISFANIVLGAHDAHHLGSVVRVHFNGGGICRQRAAAARLGQMRMRVILHTTARGAGDAGRAALSCSVECCTRCCGSDPPSLLPRPRGLNLQTCPDRTWNPASQKKRNLCQTWPCRENVEMISWMIFGAVEVSGSRELPETRAEEGHRPSPSRLSLISVVVASLAHCLTTMSWHASQHQSMKGDCCGHHCYCYCCCCWLQKKAVAVKTGWCLSLFEMLFRVLLQVLLLLLLRLKRGRLPLEVARPGSSLTGRRRQPCCFAWIDGASVAPPSLGVWVWEGVDPVQGVWVWVGWTMDEL